MPLSVHAEDKGCTPGQVVPYEPTTVTLSGRIAVRKSSHPNGTQMVYPILQLPKPVTIAGESGPSNPINAREECVREIQLYALEPSVHKKLVASQSKRVEVTGTLFHGHTAWHTRSIVMTVGQVH